MVNYKQGKIYKIECNVTGLIYIGSTCKKTLAQRMTNHRSKYKKYLNGKSNYYSSFIVMENGDYDIILIEDFPCNSKDQLFARERYHTNKTECVNIRKNQGRCLELGKKEYDKERYENHREERLEVSRQYRINNPEKVKLANQKSHQNHREERLEVSRQYNIDNNEARKEYKKKYREEHKEEISAKRIAYYHEVQSKNKEYLNMKQRENRAKRQAKKEEVII